MRARSRIPALSEEWKVYYINPEWKAPERSAVADANEAAKQQKAEQQEEPNVEKREENNAEKKLEDDNDEDAAVAEPSLWTFAGDESMHPYWAVERLTQEELLKRNADAKEGPVEINMETKFVKLHTVAVAPCGNMTIDIEMQVMTNSKQVKKGARLVAAGAKKAEQKKKRRLTGEPTKR